jgi:hypothetical protein
MFGVRLVLKRSIELVKFGFNLRIIPFTAKNLPFIEKNERF